MEETYRVKVFTPGHMLIFRRTPCRTPVEFKNVRLSEVNTLELQAKVLSLKYEIKKESDIYNENITIEELKFEDNAESDIDDTVVVEELKQSSSKTILEKLISENKD
jgi:hypothetical protein